MSSIGDTATNVITYSALSNGTPPSSGTKWLVALVLAVIAFIIYSPLIFKWTNALVDAIFAVHGSLYGIYGPTIWGLIVQSLIFLLIARLLMW